MTGSDVLDLLDYRLKSFLQNNLHWTQLSEIQEKTIPHILNNEDSLVIAPTASGKTESVLIPLYNHLLTDNPKQTSILYIAPLKALLNDMDKRLFTWNNHFGFSATKWHGDVSKKDKDKFIRRPTDILLTTPESVEVILINKYEYDKKRIFENIEYIVIDEIHSFIESERGVQLNSLLRRLKEYSDNPTIIGLSATVGNENDVAKWINHHTPATIIKSTARHDLKFKINNYSKKMDICEYLQDYIKYKVLVFGSSRKNVEELTDTFNKLDTNILIHHSSISKDIRVKNEDTFKNVDRALMTSTRTLELGIDIGNIDLVSFVTPPESANSFIQRLGRSGRSSKLHKALLFSEDNINSIMYLALMSLTYQNKVEKLNIRRRAFDIYLHQILSIIFQKTEVPITEPYYILNDTYVFSAITKKEYKEIIMHLIENRILERHQNNLSLGYEFEKLFGQVNYLNFYSVFSTSINYKIKLGIKEIGEIDVLYVFNLKKDMTFILAGKYWKIVEIDHYGRIIYVEKGEKTKNIPRWNSPTQKQSYLIMREIYNIILNNYDNILLDKFNEEFKTLIKYLNNYAQKNNLNEYITPASIKGNQVTFYTFAGEKVNYLLSYLMENQFSIKDIDIDSVYLTLQTNDNPNDIINYYNTLKDNMDENITVYINNIEDLEYQSKFGQYLPEKFQKEFVKELIFDFDNIKDLIKDTQAVDIGYVNYDGMVNKFMVDDDIIEEKSVIEEKQTENKKTKIRYKKISTNNPPINNNYS